MKHFITFCNKFNKFYNNIFGAQILLDFTYHMQLFIFLNRVLLCLKMHRVSQYATVF